MFTNFGEAIVLALSPNARIFLYQQAIDMRKGFEGLSSLIEGLFGESITNGTYFVFFNYKRDRIKMLYWDVDGLAIWYKRLERGSFLKRNAVQAVIERKEFLMLLEGVTPKHIQKRFKIS